MKIAMPLAGLLSLFLLSLPALSQVLIQTAAPEGFALPAYHARPAAVSNLPSGLYPNAVRRFYGFERLRGNGAGQTIAIIDAFDDPNIESNLKVFTTQFGLPDCTTANGCFTKAYPGGQQPAINSSWAVEIALDVEWAHAIAPGAKILLVEAVDNSFNNLLNAVNYAVAHGASVVSMSFAGTEFAQQTSFDSTFQVNNVSFVAASGDAGAGVFYPASSPYVLAVGGTSPETNLAGAHYGESAWSYSGGGQSRYEMKPTPQLNFGLRAGVPFRTVPDVAYMGDPVQGVAVYATNNVGSMPGGAWYQVGGTSAGSPQWAAILAIINGERVKAGKKSLAESYSYGTLDAIYSLARDQYGQAFYDVQRGANGYCGKACIAGPGYDVITGLGSPNIKNLVPALIAGQ
jgi:subtilase family serine protease